MAIDLLRRSYNRSCCVWNVQMSSVLVSLTPILVAVTLSVVFGMLAKMIGESAVTRCESVVSHMS